ncbi:glycosyltransferase family 2 protein [Bailinhaonella thermotolerans]|uniref:Glycosyltransferase family 2 protein n=1 Tax=Bailinhaonella thermotolerans TaxID=1070861 RepID=A0A3A4A741_9ACTN|nr:glycosyltransferase family A protein [Bailinhaonella thermotolerans]RJL21689.1 glycosyltransferase family 2 protein [Bailinhaonella thermotolerans]
MSDPSVAVIVPTLGDRPTLLAETLASVAAQDYGGEITTVVVHDRAAPDPALAAERVILVPNDRAPNAAGARNAGVLAAPETDLVAFCDDDDVWLPGKLRAQVAALAGRPGAFFAACGEAQLFPGHTVDRVLPARQITFADLLRDRLPEAGCPSFLVRRAAFLDLGMFDEEIPGAYGEDYELLLRAARRAPVVYVPEVHVYVRMRGQSHFAQDWPTIAAALTWLLARYPEFETAPRGHARLAGQIAFAHAAQGRHRQALRWALRSLRARPLEPRPYAVLAMAARLVTAPWLIRRLESRGLGF